LRFSTSLLLSVFVKHQNKFLCNTVPALSNMSRLIGKGRVDIILDSSWTNAPRLGVGRSMGATVDIVSMTLFFNWTCYRVAVAGGCTTVDCYVFQLKKRVMVTTSTVAPIDGSTPSRTLIVCDMSSGATHSPSTIGVGQAV
jgi:hypothetical protein